MLNLVIYSKNKKTVEKIVKSFARFSNINFITNCNVKDTTLIKSNNDTELFNSAIINTEKGFVQFINDDCDFIAPYFPNGNVKTLNLMNFNFVDHRFDICNFHSYIIDISEYKNEKFVFLKGIEGIIAFNSFINKIKFEEIAITTVNYNFTHKEFLENVSTNKQLIDFINNIWEVSDVTYIEKISILCNYISIYKNDIFEINCTNESYEYDKSKLMLNYFDEIQKIYSSKKVNISTFDDLLPGTLGISKNKLYISGEKNKLEDSIVFIKPQINNFGGTESLIANIAQKMPTSIIYVIGFKDMEYNQFTYPKNVVEILVGEDDKLIQKVLFTSKKTFLTSLTIFPDLIKKFALPCELNFYFLGDVKDFTVHGVYRVEYEFYLSYRYYIDNYYFISSCNAELFKINEGVNKVSVIENIYTFENQKVNEIRENFIYLSRIQQFAKNSHELIRLGKLMQEHKLKLDIYGDGPYLENLICDINKFELEDTLVIKGILVDNKIDTISKYKGLVSISSSEGFPTTFLEAYDANTPVLCFDTFTSSYDAVVDEFGYVIKNRDFEKLILKMKKLNDSKEVIKKVNYISMNKKSFEVDINKKMEEIYD